MQRSPCFPLTVFYDGSCSICAGEMAVYMAKPHEGRLHFEDISAESFRPESHGFTLYEFMREMHAIDATGRVYRATAAFWAIWQALPPSPLYSFLSFIVTFPGTSSVARLGYRIFARTRRFLPRTRTCSHGTCSIDRAKAR